MNYFTKNPNLKKIWGAGGGGGGGGVDGWSGEQAKQICPFNFFQDGGITMHKCTSYGLDKLNL